MLELTDIHKGYQMGAVFQPVLRGISQQVHKGEMLAIMGQSGSGKSTLMNLLGLLDRPDKGSYRFNGSEVSGLSDNQLAALRNRYLGFVFQQFFLLPRLNAAQNVALPLTYRGTAKAEIDARVASLLNKVGMQDRMQHRPSELSGGQQQRVAIARALVGDPALILADEPTGSLDSRTSQEVMDLFLSLNQTEHRTIIIITHDAQIGALCSRRIFMEDGKIVDET